MYFFMSILIIAIIVVEKSLSGEFMALNVKTCFAIPIFIAFCCTLFLGLKCIIDIKKEEQLSADTDPEVPSLPSKPRSRGISRRKD